MNAASIIIQFEQVEKSVSRAKLPFDVDLVHPETLKVTVYECMKAILQLHNIASEIEEQIKLLEP